MTGEQQTKEPQFGDYLKKHSMLGIRASDAETAARLEYSIDKINWQAARIQSLEVEIAHCRESASRAEDLERDKASLEKNAERYRWVRSNPDFETEAYLSVVSPEQYDEIIDANISQRKP